MSGSQEILAIAQLDREPVCVNGENGVGKNQTIRLIHKLSPRASKPLLTVNCAALPPSLIEIELFGSVKGAFTGAVNREGVFEAAKGGTLFLDEIGDVQLDLQPKLLHVLESRQIIRIGDNCSRSIDCRLMFATNRNLEFEVATGRFRADLYYRLTSAFAIHIKPLRERTEEIVSLAQEFIAEIEDETKKQVVYEELSLELLKLPRWRGNIRELRSFIRQLCIEATLQQPGCDSVTITAEHFAARVNSLVSNERQFIHSTTAQQSNQSLILGEVNSSSLKSLNFRTQSEIAAANDFLQTFERLKAEHKKSVQVAAVMGLSRRTLFYRLNKYRELLAANARATSINNHATSRTDSTNRLVA